MKKLLLTTSLLLALLGLIGCQPAAHADDIRVTILHTNDLHGQVYPVEKSTKDEKTFIGGFSAVALKIRSLRAEAEKAGAEVILVDAGDFFQGTPEGNTPPGELVVEFFNLLRYDYVVLGNHEFDFGESAVRKYTSLAKFPFLGANIIDRKTGVTPDYVKPYAVREVKGLKIAFIGLTHPEMSSLVLPKIETGLDFPLEDVTLKKVLAEKPVAEADFVVLLTHIGYDRDRRLAESFPDVPLIIGGHSHSPIAKPFRGEHGKALICQSGCKGENLGRIDIIFDSETRKAKSIDAGIIPLRSTEPPRDEETEALIEKYAAPLRKYFEARAGTAEQEFVRGGRSYGGVSSPLGNLVTDIMRSAAGVDIAFHNRTGMRADLPAGDITIRHLYEVSPFGNTLVTMELKGADLREVIEYSVSGSQFLLEISGIEFTYDPKRDKGSRVLEVAVGSNQLDPEKTYTVVTNSFIADGGDGHVVFVKGKNVKDTGVNMLDSTIEHVKSHTPLKAAYEPRIRKVKPK
ncbi:MAG: bifunctional UDP-sugar hydrolase/5'-nucleotidase [Planctomycetota bacterium]|nr:bifunctional UDP-sugar hydrolase/5'-nucleotidase [Planctomycetota bacterium]